MNYLDNAAYVEKRAAQAEEAMSQRDVLAVQNARRYLGIKKAVERFRGILRKSGLTMTEAAVYLAAVDDLERANLIREGDAGPTAYVPPARPLMMAPPTMLEMDLNIREEVAA